MSLGDGCAFVWPQLVGTETGYPHVPIPFQMQLDIFHFDFGHFAMFGEHASGIDGVLHEIIGHLQEQLFHLFVQLLGGIDFTDQFLQSRFCEHLMKLKQKNSGLTIKVVDANINDLICHTCGTASVVPVVPVVAVAGFAFALLELDE